jgi:ABC-type hemin transport system substrate-binding protein
MSNVSSPYLPPLEAPVNAPPRRVVSLVPCVTESLYDLGVGERLVGATDRCVRPAAQVERLVRVGAPGLLDVPRVISLAPDLVIASREDNRREDIEALQAAGLAVWEVFPHTVRDAFNLLWNIMHVFDSPGMVERVRAMEWTCDWLERMHEDVERLPRVFAPIVLEPLMTFGTGTYAHDVLRVCGGWNVFSVRDGQPPPTSDEDGAMSRSDSGYPLVTLEEVQALQPDVVLLPNAGSGAAESRAAWFAQMDIPAARSGRIHTIDETLLTWHGTRIAHAFETLPALLDNAQEMV